MINYKIHMHKTFNCWYVTQIRKYPAWIILGHDGMLLDSQLVIHIVAIFDATLLKTAKMKTNRFFPKHPLLSTTKVASLKHIGKSAC